MREKTNDRPCIKHQAKPIFVYPQITSDAYIHDDKIQKFFSAPNRFAVLSTEVVDIMLMMCFTRQMNNIAFPSANQNVNLNQHSSSTFYRPTLFYRTSTNNFTRSYQKHDSPQTTDIKNLSNKETEFRWTEPRVTSVTLLN